MKILLVDDHPILLAGIKAMLEKMGNYEVCGIAEDGQKAMDLLKSKPVDVMVTDLDMPEMNGLNLVKNAKLLHPTLKIIVLSMHTDPYIVKDLLKEGIMGYILKHDTQNELLTAIDRVSQGKTYFSHEINQILIKNLENEGANPLITEREREIVKLIAKEYSNKQIAEALFISERTVETHRKNIFRKTKTNSIVGLIKYAYENRLF